MHRDALLVVPRRQRLPAGFVHGTASRRYIVARSERGRLDQRGLLPRMGRGGYGPWCAQMMDGSLRPCNPHPFLAHLYTFAHWPNHPTLPSFFFFFQPLLRTFSFHPFLSFSHFFGLSIIGSFLPSGSAHTSPWENFKFSFQARFLFYITLLLIAVCVGVPSFRVLGVLLDFGRGVLVCFYSN